MTNLLSIYRTNDGQDLWRIGNGSRRNVLLDDDALRALYAEVGKALNGRERGEVQRGLAEGHQVG